MAGRNLVQATDRYAQVAAEMRAGVSQGLKDITLDLLGLSVARAPVDEGNLRGSGTAHFGGQRIADGRDFDREAIGNEGVTGGAGSDSTTGIVAFNKVYAVAQHERTDYAHPKGGEAKFLERPLEENRQRYIRHLRDSGKRAVR